MFERFTDKARKVVMLAQTEAKHLDHGYVGAEHPLLGLRREDEGVAARVLKKLGVEPDDVRERIEERTSSRGNATGPRAVFCGTAPRYSRAAWSAQVPVVRSETPSPHGPPETLHQRPAVVLVLDADDAPGLPRDGVPPLVGLVKGGQ